MEQLFESIQTIIVANVRSFPDLFSIPVYVLSDAVTNPTLIHVGHQTVLLVPKTLSMIASASPDMIITPMITEVPVDNNILINFKRFMLSASGVLEYRQIAGWVRVFSLCQFRAALHFHLLQFEGFNIGNPDFHTQGFLELHGDIEDVNEHHTVLKTTFQETDRKIASEVRELVGRNQSRFWYRIDPSQNYDIIDFPQKYAVKFLLIAKQVILQKGHILFDPECDPSVYWSTRR